MSGIAGIVNLDNQETRKSGFLLAMTSSMVHHGPDDENYFLIDKGDNIRTFMVKDTRAGLLI
jgi:asparagine synthetase B (glutamine-hydrolysing)